MTDETETISTSLPYEDGAISASAIDPSRWSMQTTGAVALTMHPLDLLDRAIIESSSKVAARDANDTTTTPSSLPCMDDEHDESRWSEEDHDDKLPRRRSSLHEILEIADFLFGPLLDSALALLDTCSISENGMAVRKVCAIPSGRSAYFVRGSALLGRRKVRTAEYMCLMNAPLSSYYCSCRSFYERLKQTTTGSVHHQPLGGGALCKHLLAAKMAPILDYSFETIHVTEERFVQLMVQSTAVLEPM